VRLFKRPPALCSIPHCSRLASLRLSCLDDVALSCALHVITYEKKWGQVFVRGLS
jgi:hypothetical protein